MDLFKGSLHVLKGVGQTGCSGDEEFSENKFKTSARNKFCGRISTINSGTISVEVIVDLSDGTKITSLITDESASGLGLKVGDEICALVKAFSVILTVE